MNRRILKKLCKRAMEVLIEHHGFAAHAFTPSGGSESIGAPPGMPRRQVRTYGGPEPGWLHPGPLKGTPLYWCRTSYEYDEWDAKLPTDVLDEITFWASLTNAEFLALLTDEPAQEADHAE